ncbi:MAG: dTMP kinase [Desulfobulbaceae bacterium A2]|nr:MAG: dTMP kinase [Desulfobulbaceae bacterium A2]
MTAGRLIAFEGVDGTGKTTQIALLRDRLIAEGLPPLVTREPTDGPHGRRLRELFHDRARVGGPTEELELFLADRRQHVTELIGPALAQGRIVLTDRYYFSTAAYQGAAGLDPAEILARNDFAPQPDLVLLLTLPLSAALARIRARPGEQPNDFEQESQLRQVTAIYESFFQPCIRRIDAKRPIAEIAQDIWAHVRTILPANGV